jgi:hypothetical protein
MTPLARSLQIPTRTTDLQVGTGFYAVTGWSFKETTGSATASLELVDGAGVDGNLIAAINLKANESTRDLAGISAIAAEMGLFVHVISGSIKGAVWAIPGNEMGVLAIERGLGRLWAGEQ